MTSRLVPHTPRSAASVRREMVVDLTACDVPPAVVDDAALVMSELVGNAVRHGSPLPDGCVRVSWDLLPDRLHLEVWDGGAAVDRVAERGGVAPSSESGRGLTIVGLLAEQWGTTPCPGAGIGVYADLSVQPNPQG